ncbi:MAG: GTP-binding protein [Acidimicrobiales bacterium]|jgi:G3E family GTPase
MPKIPSTVLTGFLGSGKTTLLNYILTASHGKRIAVIENEFGEIAIDNALVLQTDEEIFEMSNGCCLCCTARTDLIRILHTLLERRDRFDRIIIETSGLADPNPVAQTFFVDEEIASNIELDAIITLVDGLHISGHLDEVDSGGVGDQAFDQIAFADRLIINKMDLIGGEEVANLTARLRSINATAPIVTSSYAEVDLDNILGVGAFDLSHTMAIDPSWLERNDHAHEPGLESVSLQQAGDLDAGELDRWLTALLEARGDDIYRMKGIVAVAGDDRRHVLQGVHRIFEQRPVDPWGSEARDNRVIFIGRNLDREGLVQGLARCSADRAPAAAATAGTLDQES